VRIVDTADGCQLVALKTKVLALTVASLPGCLFAFT
jgi:hypothetical protein